jgi:probable 2-oxoglutarate dehydrogenase E1 component DHKTD1
MGPNTKFQPVISDNVKDAQRIILCSGKHYYTLSEAITKAGIKDINLVRVEELSPFPYAELKEVLSQYSPDKVTKVTWAQEEPANQGAWTFVRPRLDGVLSELGFNDASYAGRKAGATTATGVGAWHKEEMVAIVRDALEA